MTSTERVLAELLLQDIADDFKIVFDYRPKLRLTDDTIIISEDGLTEVQVKEISSWVTGYMRAMSRTTSGLKVRQL